MTRTNEEVYELVNPIIKNFHPTWEFLVSPRQPNVFIAHMEVASSFHIERFEATNKKIIVERILAEFDEMIRLCQHGKEKAQAMLDQPQTGEPNP